MASKSNEGAGFYRVPGTEIDMWFDNTPNGGLTKVSDGEPETVAEDTEGTKTTSRKKK